VLAQVGPAPAQAGSCLHAHLAEPAAPVQLVRSAAGGSAAISQHEKCHVLRQQLLDAITVPACGRIKRIEMRFAHLEIDHRFQRIARTVRRP